MPRLRRLRFGRSGFAINMSSLAGLKAKAQRVSGIGVRKFFMEERQLAPASLLELGSEEVVAELLAGKREFYDFCGWI